MLAVGLLVLASAAGGFALGRCNPSRAHVETSVPAASTPRDASKPVATTPPATARLTAPATPPPVSADAAAAAVRPREPTVPAAGAEGANSTSVAGWKRLAVTLDGPLEQAVVRALPSEDRGLAEELAQMANRILAWYLRISHDGRRGDRLEALYLPPSGERRELVIQAVRYTSLKLGRTVEALRYQPEGSAFARYYQPDGSEVEARLLEGPIADYEQVTSLLNDGRRHKGVDFKTPVGSPVTAPFDGVVVRRNWHFSSNGNCLEILDNGSGRHAIFLHLESVPRELQPGTQIHKGQLIAHSGNSGHSTAPHLHYQLESSDGRILDPFAIHRTYRTTLQGATRTRFDEMRVKLEGLLTRG